MRVSLADIQLSVTDLDSGRTFSSADLSMNVSPHASMVQHYAAMPCDQVVCRSFELELAERVPELPPGATRLEIIARYQGHTSNRVRLERFARHDAS